MCYSDKMTLDQVIAALKAAQPELSEQYGVSTVQVFGSMARGDADEVSDIDVAVAFDGGVDPMAVCGVSGLLSARLGRDVDVVALPVRDQSLAASIEREAVHAF
ncbi:MAG: nucleotidyltransferase family protein [Oceanicaulis sp.]